MIKIVSCVFWVSVDGLNALYILVIEANKTDVLEDICEP